jgi:exo-beta-1,3-glucanase (GH17 family)
MLCKPSRSSVRLIPTLFVFVGICLAGVIWLGLSSTHAATPEESLTPSYQIELVPDQMTLSGDVTTRDNCVDPTVCSWLEGTPIGTIMLGVDPTSPLTTDWDGGSAIVEVPLDDIPSPRVFVLKLSWPDRDGKGLHSPERYRMGTITFDGHPIWGKRTTQLSTFDDYYAAEHEPILTTIVVKQSGTYTLKFDVPARTAWDLSQIELNAYPYPATIRGIGYSPFRDCQFPNPAGISQPSTEEMEEDLFRLLHTANAIRTYSATGVNGQIPALANAIGLPVFAGAWMDYPRTTIAQDDAELQALIDLACTTDLEGGIVGNEYYLRHRTTGDINYLLQAIRRVKNGVRDKCGRDLPVTTAEIDNLIFTWNNLNDFEPEIDPAYRPIFDEIDFVMVHIYPFWNGMPIDGSATFTVKRYKAIQELIEREYPGQNKWIVIGETGWPSGGAPNGAAVPNPENQRRFLLEFLSLAEQENVEYMYFDAFDELWKIEEPGRVGQNWGYSYSDRTAKHNFYGVLLPMEQVFPYQVYLPYIAKQASASMSYSSIDFGAEDTLPHNPIQSSSTLPFPVYTEWPAGPEGFVPSGWMGDIENIGMFECDRTDPHGGELAIRASLSTTGTLGWSGVYWQHPENNWGDDPEGGVDLSSANKLTFWAKGENGGEKIRFFAGGVGAASDPYPDSLRPAVSTGFIQLEKNWQQYMINLVGQDLSNVVGGFGWAADRCANPSGATFYLDDIVFEFDPTLPPLPAPGPVFPVYTDAAAQSNHYFPTGWMGDGEVPGRMSLTECWTSNPHSGQTSIRIAYTTVISGWSGIYWQHPENNWGDRPGGFDLSGTNKLTFWAKGQNGGEKIRFFVGGIGTDSDPYPDSLRPEISTGFVQLQSSWQQYTINLVGQDLSKVVGGFGWATDQCANPTGATFYLDDIVFDHEPGLLPPPGPSPVFPIYTDAAAQSNHYFPTAWMGDGEVPGRVSLTECWTNNPHSGQTAIRVAYTDKVIGWAGIEWVHPAENWGDRPGGFDLSGADRLTFWARSDTPNAKVKFLIGGIGYPVDYQGNADCSNPEGSFPDSVCPKIEQTETLSSTWTKYTIPLPQSRDLGKVVGGFGWVAEDEVTFYLDDIVYEFD